MNKKFDFDRNTLQILYFNYKEYIIPGIIVLVCMILFIKVVIPQAQQLFVTAEEVKVYQERITILKNNLNFLLNLDDVELDRHLRVVTSYLPIEKDYVGILSAISDVSSESGVDVGDFGFIVGELSSPSAQIKEEDRPMLQTGLILSGSGSKIRSFLKNLSERFPLSEVLSIQTNNESTTIDTNFYYRPLGSIMFDEAVLIQPLSNKNKALIDKLASWQQASLDFNLLPPSSSSPSAISPASISAQL